MRENIKQKGKKPAAWAFALFGGNGLAARAAGSDFVTEARLLPTNEETYDIQVSIENLGADWEGAVCVIVDEENRCPAAYDTVISLPQGSKKQFVVKAPMNSMEDTDGAIWISLWAKKNNKVADKQFQRFLTGEAEVLAMGILSDDYFSLTYLDMGGEELYFYGDEYPIRLEKLKQENLLDMLEALAFLVIDNYHTDVLTEEELQAIEH